MTAYYNEIDPVAAQWLRNLIAAGHIAPGDVDERSIEDVRPDDLRGYVQCHFFAGIGIWSHALRRAGWADDRPVWSGSCPCQPFSAAGKGAGFADERHLWPHFFHLITQCRPASVLGEQVASRDGLAWLDTVSADLEAAAYAVGAVDLCAAGVGAPHIRQRLWWVADATGVRPQARPRDPRSLHSPQQFERPSGAVRLDDSSRTGLEGLGVGPAAPSGRVATVRPAAEAGESGGVADADMRQPEQPTRERAGPRPAEGERPTSEFDGRGQLGASTGPTGPTNGFWRDADWLACRDGKWRPVEPGTFPLAHGAPGRVGRLRAYGNGIVAQAAEAFIRSVM